MTTVQRVALALAIVASSTAIGRAQQTAPAAALTDVYHVMFVKALPGQAGAVATELLQQDPKDPMASHFVLLRHQEGDDWDYCVIQHAGTTATVRVTPAPSATLPATRAWHHDTYVAGPSWTEFSRVMGLTGQSGTSVYIVGVHRAVPGRRTQLLEVLDRPDANAKVPIGHVTLAHLEGGPWQFLSIDRYNSWQDLAAARAANAAGDQQGWLDVRQHSAYHTDTIADRVAPK